MQTITSKVTSKGQTTIPHAIRKALGISPGDEIAFILEDDQLIVRKAQLLDIAYYKSISASFSSEWDSPEDNEAFNDL